MVAVIAHVDVVVDLIVNVIVNVIVQLANGVLVGQRCPPAIEADAQVTGAPQLGVDLQRLVRGGDAVAVSGSPGDNVKNRFGHNMPRAQQGIAEIAKGISKVGEGKYEIRRSALNKVLGNTTLLARSARIVPSVKNGKPNGFKLYAIRPGSLYSLLGMFNGDTISAINGHSITTPDKALEVYTKLRSASHLSISFARRGTPLTHEYTIR